uniref:5-hydroxyisourate hydrolase n=1 Tax=Cacopsylla melanoneura TaxID=428564 RepID=A0A8D8PZM5_9HEMI
MIHPKNPSPVISQPEKKSAPSFQPISTHVIDSQVGLPIPNLEITLYKLVEGRWRFVSEIITNAGGRASSFISDMSKFQCGRYKLHYHVVKYFDMRNIPTVFSFIEVAFDVRSLIEQLHFPLVVSANGYNVYKGCAL